jgi:hypothetical protein
MNPEVLAIHKDPLARSAVRVDIGGKNVGKYLAPIIIRLGLVWYL